MCISIFYLSILILFGDWIKQAVRGVFSTEFLFLNAKIFFCTNPVFYWSNFYEGMFISAKFKVLWLFPVCLEK